MEAYLESRFSESMEIFEQMAKSYDGPDVERALLLCNIGAAAFGKHTSASAMTEFM
jgi:hypothetical protein